MSDMIEINITPSEYGYVSYSDKYGGKVINISISTDVIEALNWIKNYRILLEQEEQVRQSYPFVNDQYLAYQAALRLAKTE